MSTFYKQLSIEFTTKCKLPIPEGSLTRQIPGAFTVECLCPDGTQWDEECQDCVPVCFDMFLSYLESWNSSFN